jgi:hypothetical protein
MGGDFKIVKENTTSVTTEFLSLNGGGSFDIKNYDKRSGVTTYYDTGNDAAAGVSGNAYLAIGNMTWPNLAYVLKTFDNGTGIFSLYADDSIE